MEYLAASYILCYFSATIFNMEPVNLTAVKLEVVIWSQCRKKKKEKQNDWFILECIKLFSFHSLGTCLFKLRHNFHYIREKIQPTFTPYLNI